MREIAKKHPEAYLKLMGDGNEKEVLEKLTKELDLENRVEFLGRVPREETSPRYQEASIFVMASLNEGMSNAMLEALACGLPIISTRTGGAQELVQEGMNGFFIKTKDSKDLAEKMEKLLSNSKLCEKMGEESRKIAEKMSWQNVAKKYLQEYEKINEEK